MVVAVTNPQPWWEHTVEILGLDLTVLFAVFGPFIVPLLIFLAVQRWIKPAKPTEEASAARKGEPQEPAGMVQPLETKEELGRRESQEWNAERLRRFGLVAHRRRRHRHHRHHHRHPPQPLKPGSEALCF